jgi:hypothetical protein
MLVKILKRVGEEGGGEQEGDLLFLTRYDFVAPGKKETYFATVYFLKLSGLIDPESSRI